MKTKTCSVLVDGKKCGAILESKASVIAEHNEKVHGIKPKVETPLPVIADAASVPTDAKSKDQLERAKKIEAMRLEAILKTDGPNAMLTSQEDDLRRWVKIARAAGVVKAGESTYWGEIGKDEQYITEGRHKVLLYGAPITVGDVQLWARDKRITNAEEKARVAASNAQIKSYREENEKKTQEVEKELED